MEKKGLREKKQKKKVKRKEEKISKRREDLKSANGLEAKKKKLDKWEKK